MQQAAKPESPESETANHSDECWPSGSHLAAPVTVHWAVTHNCLLRCPECYVRRYTQGFSTELTLPESLRLVKVLADWGVFEVAIGGGEPLGFPLLPAIIKEARRQGLVVHLTTGWDHVPAARLAELAEGITGLQIGVQAEPLLAHPSTEAAVLARTAAAAAQAGLKIPRQEVVVVTGRRYDQKGCRYHPSHCFTLCETPYRRRSRWNPHSRKPN